MDRSYTMPRLCFILTTALTLLCVALRSICMLFFFDADPGYFTEGLLPTLCDLSYVAVVIVSVVCCCLIPKSSLPTELHTRMRAPVALLPGLALAAFTVVSLIVCLPARTSNIVIAPALLGLPAAAYYFVSARRNGRYPDRLSFLGYLPVLWSVAAVAEVYFDNYTTMNSPIKISLQFAFLGLMFISLAELRFRVGRISPRYSVALLAIGSFTTLVASIPLLIATGARILDNIQHLLYAIVLLCVGLYGLYTLFRYTCFPSDMPAPAESTEEEDAAPPADPVPTDP